MLTAFCSPCLPPLFCQCLRFLFPFVIGRSRVLSILRKYIGHHTGTSSLGATELDNGVGTLSQQGCQFA